MDYQEGLPTRQLHTSKPVHTWSSLLAFKITAASVTLLIGLLIGLILFKPNGRLIPRSIRRKASMTLYYPEQATPSEVATGSTKYLPDKQVFSFVTTAAAFTTPITVVEQSAPPSIVEGSSELSKLLNKYQNFGEINSSLGKVYLAHIASSKKEIAMVAKPGTFISATSDVDLDGTVWQRLFNGFKPSNQP